MGAGKSNSANLIRLRALAYENGGEPDAIGAVMDWAGYHRVAVRAKLFPETGPVSSVLFLHMAQPAEPGRRGDVEPDTAQAQWCASAGRMGLVVVADTSPVN